MGLGSTELLIILGIIVVLFGAAKLPELGAGIGKGIRNFKKASKGDDEIDVTPEKKQVHKGEEESENKANS